jgi:hypothetical protein
VIVNGVVVIDNERHTGAWKCIECPAVLVLDESDPRAHERSVPRCVECGALTAAYGPITRAVN